MAAITLTIVIVVAGLGIYYYYASSSGPTARPVTVVLTIAAPGGENASSVVSPQNFTLIEGQGYTLFINNSENTEHELVIPTFNVTTGIIQGQQNVAVTLVPNQVGVFPYYQPASTMPYPQQEDGISGGFVTVIPRITT
jgi:hypothetical protein